MESCARDSSRRTWEFIGGSTRGHRGTEARAWAVWVHGHVWGAAEWRSATHLRADAARRKSGLRFEWHHTARLEHTPAELQADRRRTVGRNQSGASPTALRQDSRA